MLWWIFPRPQQIVGSWSTTDTWSGSCRSPTSPERSKSAGGGRSKWLLAVCSYTGRFLSRQQLIPLISRRRSTEALTRFPYRSDPVAPPAADVGQAPATDPGERCFYVCQVASGAP